MWWGLVAVPGQSVTKTYCGKVVGRYQRPVGSQETNLEEGGAVRKHPQVEKQCGVGPVAEIVAA